jgi:hypothetical protein
MGWWFWPLWLIGGWLVQRYGLSVLGNPDVRRFLAKMLDVIIKEIIRWVKEGGLTR